MSSIVDKIFPSYKLGCMPSILCLTSSFTANPNTLAYMCFFSEEERIQYNKAPTTSLNLKNIYIHTQCFNRDECKSIVTTCRLALLIINGKTEEPLKLAVCNNFSEEFPNRRVENITIIDDISENEQQVQVQTINGISIPMVSMSVDDYKAATQSYINILGYASAVSRLIAYKSISGDEAYDIVSKFPSAAEAYKYAISISQPIRSMEPKPAAASAAISQVDSSQATIMPKPMSRAAAPAKAKSECTIM